MITSRNLLSRDFTASIERLISLPPIYYYIMTYCSLFRRSSCRLHPIADFQFWVPRWLTGQTLLSQTLFQQPRWIQPEVLNPKHGGKMWRVSCHVYLHHIENSKVVEQQRGFIRAKLGEGEASVSRESFFQFVKYPVVSLAV